MVPGGNGFDPLQAFDLVINLADGTAVPGGQEGSAGQLGRRLGRVRQEESDGPALWNLGADDAASDRRRDDQAARRISDGSRGLSRHVSFGERSGRRPYPTRDRRGDRTDAARRAKARSRFWPSPPRSDWRCLPNVPSVSETFPGFNVLSYLGLGREQGNARGLDHNAQRTSSTGYWKTAEVREFLDQAGNERGRRNGRGISPHRSRRTGRRAERSFAT